MVFFKSKELNWFLFTESVAVIFNYIPAELCVSWKKTEVTGAVSLLSLYKFHLPLIQDPDYLAAAPHEI